MPVDRFVLISGCSGGGKSALLAELRRRGFCVVAEPGRRIIAEELANGGGALPWVNLAAFAQRAMAMARADRAAATGLVFFDRGLVDAAAALEWASGKSALREIAGERYHDRVFVVPPWPEIYRNDPNRKHGLLDAIAEHERLMKALSALNYTIELLPKTGVAPRADFLLERLRLAPGG